MVPKERVELSQGCPHRFLRPARIPIPPLRLLTSRTKLLMIIEWWSRGGSAPRVGPRTHTRSAPRLADVRHDLWRTFHPLDALGSLRSLFGIERKNNGGAEGDRTPDLLNAIQVCSQLHHCPTSQIIRKTARTYNYGRYLPF